MINGIVLLFMMKRYRYDMNKRSQMLGGKNWILPKERKRKCKPVLLRLSLAGNLENRLCPFMRLNGGSVAMDSADDYIGIITTMLLRCSNIFYKLPMKLLTISKKSIPLPLSEPQS
jgi:hypothetical protein